MFWGHRFLEELVTDTQFQGRLLCKSNSASISICNLDIRDCTRVTAVWLFYRRIPTRTGNLFRCHINSRDRSEDNVIVRKCRLLELRHGRRSRTIRRVDRVERGQGDGPPPEWEISGAIFLRLAVGVGCELGDSVDVPVRDAHPGGAAFSAGEIRGFEYRHRYSASAGQHYAANSEPHSAPSHHRKSRLICRGTKACEPGRSRRKNAERHRNRTVARRRQKAFCF